MSKQPMIVGQKQNVDPALERLLQMLDAQRVLAGNGGFQWSFNFEQFNCPLPSGKNGRDYALALESRAANPLKGALKEESINYNGEVAYQPSTGRFHFWASYVVKWFGGPVDYYGTREEIAFDGNLFWNFQAVRPGAELPSQDFTGMRNLAADWTFSESISPQVPPENRIEHLADKSGFNFRPGYMTLPYGQTKWPVSVEVAGFLRELLRAGEDLQVEERGPLTTVEFRVPEGDGRSRSKGSMILTFNMDQLAAIERITYMAYGPGRVKLRNADYAIHNTEVRSGVWFPQEIIWGDWMNSLVTRVKLTNVREREKFDAVDFQVTFPLTTNDTDTK